MFLDVRPKLQTKPFGEIWAWSFCKVGVINVSLVGGTRLLTCPFLDIQSNSFKKSGILNHVQVYRQRKIWKRVVDDIFESLELDKGEWVESISKGETSIKEFLALVDESIKESNRCQFLKGLNNKTKLTIYKTFGGKVKFKRYLNGVGAWDWVMQELVYSLNYVLERMDLMRSWVDIEVEKVSVCVICAVRTVKVWVTFCEIARFIQSTVHYF